MKQVTQTVCIGVVEINDVPALNLLGKFILVRNSVSLISARTENSKIDTVKISIAKGHVMPSDDDSIFINWNVLSY